jgi:hypothetical protein
LTQGVIFSLWCSGLNKLGPILKKLFATVIAVVWQLASVFATAIHFHTSLMLGAYHLSGVGKGALPW